MSRPSLGVDELSRIKEVLDSGWLGHGVLVNEFERRLKALLDGAEVVAVSSGTAALHLALAALGIGAGDEVIVPSLTFCGGVQAITALGAKPVFCEVSTETLNVDVEDVRQRITTRTRAIMPVHFCGNACDMDALLTLGRQHGLRIVEDAAHAFGSSYRGRKIGSFGDLTCFSFDPIKNITCGEGGAVALRDEALAEVIRRKRMVGIECDAWRRSERLNSWDYEVTTQGYRYHLSNVNAAIGLAQLEKMEAFRQRKQAIVRRYLAEFSDESRLVPLHWRLEESFPFAYVTRVVGGRRDELLAHLKEHDVAAGVHYPLNHRQPYFRQPATVLPVSEALADEILTLPLYHDLTDQEVSHVIGAVRGWE